MYRNITFFREFGDAGGMYLIRRHWKSSNGGFERRKRTLFHFYNLPKEGFAITVLSLLFLCLQVSGNESYSSENSNSYDWINKVPFRSIPTLTVQEVEKWPEVQGQIITSSPHPIDSSDEAVRKEWLEAHKNDPSMGFFYAPVPAPATPPSTSTTRARATQLPETTKPITEPMPSTTTPSPYQPLPITGPAASNLGNDDFFLQRSKKKRKRKKFEKKSSPVKKYVSPSSTAPSPSEVLPLSVSSSLTSAFPSSFIKTLSQKWSDVLKYVDTQSQSRGRRSPLSNGDVESGRTFFLSPLLAYLFPVFIAQMFGMGMIPAAAIIMLPVFLLPLGLAAAIFLI